MRRNNYPLELSGDCFELVDRISCDEVIYEDGEFLVFNVLRCINIRDKIKQTTIIINLPAGKFDFKYSPRIMRRFFRSNRVNCYRVNKSTFVFIRNYVCYKFDYNSRDVDVVFPLPNTRNVMSGAISGFESGGFAFGDYFARTIEPIFLHCVDGQWNYYNINISNIVNLRHVHNIQYIQELDRFFVTTGDYDGECWILELDRGLGLVDLHGNGSQIFRACSLVYDNGKLIWGMDSPLTKSKLITYDYVSKNIIDKTPIGGPCLYMHKVHDYIVFTTSCEPSDHLVKTSLNVYCPKNHSFIYCQSFQKDSWPFIFKFGTISIIPCDDNHLWLNFEAIRNYDGLSVKVRL